ncbi:MAG: YggS family pyridoxal phosphate-dependent enzyme [Burkholderiales bacterium]|nr:YggS family pyridoxal phosphate-dependent enzyme [Burkholderiales bacterium]
MSQYEKAWQAVLQRIDRACRAAGRTAGSVHLLAVSKTFPADAVRAVYAAGQRAFGENYVQEAAAKRESLADLADVEWHLIGPLQANKTAIAAAGFDWIESVDRMKIAQRLSDQRPESCLPLSVCVQVNASGEASKSGVTPEAAVAFARGVAGLPRLRLRGIMGIPAPTSDATVARAQFRVLHECFDGCREAGLAVDTLSMGMSADLELAITEGSTQVRVGTAIFGDRSA